MRIGIDIDGVILNSENLFRVKSELYDLLTLHKEGVVNPNGFNDKDRFNWTEEEVSEFRKCFIKVTEESSLMPGVKEVLQLLKNDKHELIIITARGITVKKMEEAGKERLEYYGLKFDEYFWAVNEKYKICKSENIDIMIDDNPLHCRMTSENKIKTLYFRDVNREKLEENEYLKEVNNWGEVYRYIYNLNLKEK